MTRYLYLAVILVSIGGVVLFDRRFGAGVVGLRLLVTAAITVPLFLCFDLLGASRGWFASSPRLNSVIVRPGIPLEEPILLFFLTLVSVSLWQAGRRLLP